MLLNYKGKPINDVQGNNSCLPEESYKTYKYVLRAKWKVYRLQECNSLKIS
jgi:hypothetical protein